MKRFFSKKHNSDRSSQFSLESDRASTYTYTSDPTAPAHNDPTYTSSSYVSTAPTYNPYAFNLNHFPTPPTHIPYVPNSNLQNPHPHNPYLNVPTAPTNNISTYASNLYVPTAATHNLSTNLNPTAPTGNRSTHTSNLNVPTAPTHNPSGNTSNLNIPTTHTLTLSRPPSYDTLTMAPTDDLPGRDFESVSLPPEFSATDTRGVVDISEVVTIPNYIYYRIYAQDGAIPSKIPAVPGDPFVGRIKARSVPPPHTAKAVKHSIAKVENIEDRTSTSLFLTTYSQSPIRETDRFPILTRTGPGSTPQEPLALVADISDSERSALESGGRGELPTVAESNTSSPEIRYLYYLIYADEYEVPSKAAFDPEEPSLGRIRADFIAPPHSPASIRRCISRVEKNPALAHGNLFADISGDAPLKEGYISILRGTCPGLNPYAPMAIVQIPILQVPIVQGRGPSIPDGRYAIKNRAENIYWNAANNPIRKVFYLNIPNPEEYTDLQWDITHDSNDNIFITSPFAPSCWVGAEITGSRVPVAWLLIPAPYSGFFYLTTDTKRTSQKIQVPMVHRSDVKYFPGSMGTLKEGDQRQMWEFIRIKKR